MSKVTTRFGQSFPSYLWSARKLNFKVLGGRWTVEDRRKLCGFYRQLTWWKAFTPYKEIDVKVKFDDISQVWISMINSQSKALLTCFSLCVLICDDCHSQFSDLHWLLGYKLWWRIFHSWLSLFQLSAQMGKTSSWCCCHSPALSFHLILLVSQT